MKKATIPICYRNGESGKLEITDVAYEGCLEPKTMRRVNKLFLEKAGSGYFYPLEPLDAYHDATQDTPSASMVDSTDRGEIVLAFRAYVVADGNLFEAARLARMPKTTFYRKWPGWIAAAKKVGNSLGGIDTIWIRR